MDFQLDWRIGLGLGESAEDLFTGVGPRFGDSQAFRLAASCPCAAGRRVVLTLKIAATGTDTDFGSRHHLG